MNLKRLSQFGSPILGLLLFGVSLWAIATQLREFDYRDIFRSLAEIPKSYIVLALICTALNYLMLTGYDALAMRYIRRSIPRQHQAGKNFSLTSCSRTDLQIRVMSDERSNLIRTHFSNL